jgi:hypothetical protein
MGVVYLAEDATLGRQVALKLLRPDAGDPASTGRFRREARLAATLSHPHLCPVYDFGHDSGVDYLTMPYIPGESLAARVARGGPLPVDEAVRLVRAIAAAMQSAHSAGVIHRDLKPGNVILNENGDPVVTDFGLARRVAGEDPRLTGSGAVLGTPAYMPPEQIGANPEAVGPACDVYSLGAIFYELLSGRPPFTGQSSGEVLRQVLTAEPTPLRTLHPEVPRHLDAVCLRALAKDPAKRFRSMGEFAAALDEGPARTRWIWWTGGAAAAALALVAWAGYPAAEPATGPPPGERAQPAAASADPVGAGTRWVGDFQFGGADGPTGAVVLTVTERSGEEFVGRYETEHKYEWEVRGTVKPARKVSFALVKPLNAEAEATNAKAEVTGEYRGPTMTLTFRDKNDGSIAAIILTLEK